MSSSPYLVDAFDEEGLWPTLEQELLLRAALLDGEKAIEAWTEWRQRIDPEGEFGQGSFRLLPLLFHNVHKLGVSDPFMARLKGIYRRSWYETHQLFYATQRALVDLNKAGVKTLLLKGAPLSLQYYDNIALRPMSDLDILVPTDKARTAIEQLESTGWKRTQRASDKDLIYRHAIQFRDPDKGEVDLHWHALFECCQSDVDQDFWDSCVPFDFNGTPTQMLDPTDMLFHVVVHGIRWNPMPSIRWIADAVMIMNCSYDEIDWRRLIDLGKERELGLRLRKGFSYLEQRMDQPVPDWVLNELASQKIGAMEIFENNYVMRDKRISYQLFLGPLILAYAEYRRFANHRGLVRSLFGFPEYLQYRWALRGRMEVLVLLVKKGFGRVWRKLAQRDTPNERLVKKTV